MKKIIQNYNRIRNQPTLNSNDHRHKEKKKRPLALTDQINRNHRKCSFCEVPHNMILKWEFSWMKMILAKMVEETMVVYPHKVSFLILW